MTALGKDAFLDRLPDEVEIRNAEQLRTIVASQIREGERTTLSLALDGGKAQSVTLTPALAASLLEVLRLVSSGRGFRMIPVESELTTQQAADLLNVSRPFLVKLLEEGDIPFTKTGRHRRVRADDLFAYKEKRDAARSDALGDLARVDAEDGLV
ncbi:MAG: helix-turn-helix domain-containing protein [Boseongicola sp.]|nr:helix-turn-helix domain-containing protein [Boseongicola sp.]